MTQDEDDLCERINADVVRRLRGRTLSHEAALKIATDTARAVLLVVKPWQAD